MFNYWFTILTYSRNRDFSSGAVSDTVSFFRFVCDVLVDRLVTAGQTAGVSSRRYEGHRPAAVQGSRWGQKNASNVPDCIRFAQRRIYGFWCPGQDFQTVPPPLSDGPSDDGFQLTLSVSKFTYLINE